MSKRQPLRRAPWVNTLAIGMIAGLLIWAKLRLVTDFPRIVQADPPERAVGAGDADPAETPPTNSGHQAPQAEAQD